MVPSCPSLRAHRRRGRTRRCWVRRVSGSGAPGLLVVAALLPLAGCAASSTGTGPQTVAATTSSGSAAPQASGASAPARPAPGVHASRPAAAMTRLARVSSAHAAGHARGPHLPAACRSRRDVRHPHLACGDRVSGVERPDARRCRRSTHTRRALGPGAPAAAVDHRDRGTRSTSPSRCCCSVSGGRVVRAIHVSTGMPGWPTPRGHFTILQRDPMSWSVRFQVWMPLAQYFQDGYVRCTSSPDVPAYPASHGCVRVPACRGARRSGTSAGSECACGRPPDSARSRSPRYLCRDSASRDPARSCEHAREHNAASATDAPRITLGQGPRTVARTVGRLPARRQAVLNRLSDGYRNGPG